MAYPSRNRLTGWTGDLSGCIFPMQDIRKSHLINFLPIWKSEKLNISWFQLQIMVMWPKWPDFLSIIISYLVVYIQVHFTPDCVGRHPHVFVFCLCQDLDGCRSLYATFIQIMKPNPAGWEILPVTLLIYKPRMIAGLALFKCLKKKKKALYQ